MTNPTTELIAAALAHARETNARTLMRLRTAAANYEALKIPKIENQKGRVNEHSS